VPPAAFRPPPQVDSSVVRLTPLPASQRPDPTLSRTIEKIVRAAFGKRRKTLANALSGVLDRDAIEAADVDPGARAETLAPQRYVALARIAAQQADLPEAAVLSDNQVHG